MDNILIFGLDGTKTYAESIASCLKLKLAKHEEKYFDDGEPYVRPDLNVRGQDVFVIQSLYSDNVESGANKFVKLLMFVGALKDASADRVTVVCPYLIMSRQDRKVESRAPIATKYVAQMFESVGTDRVLTMDVHNLAAFQNAFRIPVDNLESKTLFANWFATDLANCKEEIAILSPDSGGYARAVRFRTALAKKLNRDIEVAIFDKLRLKNEVKGSRIVGHVKNAKVICYDDMISTGATAFQAYQPILSSESEAYAVCATHGLFVGQANDYFRKMDTKIVISDTIPPFRLNADNSKKLQVISTTKMFAEAINRIHNGTGSISSLLE